jgi:hypothetical protein
MYHDVKTNQTKHLGSPMEDAVYRTNHGYDPTIRKTYLWPPGNPEFDDSVLRYFILVDALKHFEEDEDKIDLQDAIYLCRLMGQKGPDYDSCPDVRISSAWCLIHMRGRYAQDGKMEKEKNGALHVAIRLLN